MIIFILLLIYIISLNICLGKLSGYVWFCSFLPIVNTIMAIIILCGDNPTDGWGLGDSYSDSSDSSDSGGGDD